MFKEYKRFRYFVKYSCAQEMELLAPTLENFLYFRKELTEPENQTKNLPKEIFRI